MDHPSRDTSLRNFYMYNDFAVNYAVLNHCCLRSWNIFFIFYFRLWIAKRRLLCFQRHHSPLFVLGMPNWGFLERFHLQGTCLGLGFMVSHYIQIWIIKVFLKGHFQSFKILFKIPLPHDKNINSFHIQIRIM